MSNGLPASLLFLARVFERGLTGETRALAARMGLVGPGEVDEVEEAARHESLVGLSVPPYAGTFLSPDGTVGESSEEYIVRVLGGRRPSEPPEHLAGLAAGLAMLVQEGSPETAAFCANQVMAWVPSWSHAARSSGFADYADCGDILVEYAIRLAGPERPETVHQTGRPGSDAGLGEVSDYLTKHARTGVFVGKTTIRSWARACDCPVGMIPGPQMLKNLMDAAARFGSLDRLQRLMEVEADAQESAWRNWASRAAALSHWHDHWLACRSGYRATVGQLATAHA